MGYSPVREHYVALSNFIDNDGTSSEARTQLFTQAVSTTLSDTYNNYPVWLYSVRFGDSEIFKLVIEKPDLQWTIKDIVTHLVSNPELKKSKITHKKHVCDGRMQILDLLLEKYKSEWDTWVSNFELDDIDLLAANFDLRLSLKLYNAMKGSANHSQQERLDGVLDRTAKYLSGQWRSVVDENPVEKRRGFQHLDSDGPLLQLLFHYMKVNPSGFIQKYMISNKVFCVQVHSRFFNFSKDLQNDAMMKRIYLFLLFVHPNLDESILSDIEEKLKNGVEPPCRLEQIISLIKTESRKSIYAYCDKHRDSELYDFMKERLLPLDCGRMSTESLKIFLQRPPKNMQFYSFLSQDSHCAFTFSFESANRFKDTLQRKEEGYYELVLSIIICLYRLVTSVRDVLLFCLNILRFSSEFDLIIAGVRWVGELAYYQGLKPLWSKCQEKLNVFSTKIRSLPSFYLTFSMLKPLQMQKKGNKAGGQLPSDVMGGTPTRH